MKKVPHTPQKLPKQKYCYPRKEVRTTCFLFLCHEGEFSLAVCAEQILVCAPIAYRLLQSLALRGVGGRWRFPQGALCRGTIYSRGLFEKSPPRPPKLPQKRNRYPRKEVRTTCFLFLCREGEFSRTRTAIQTPVCASPARGLLRSLALRGVGG